MDVGIYQGITICNGGQCIAAHAVMIYEAGTIAAIVVHTGHSGIFLNSQSLYITIKKYLIILYNEKKI